MSRIGKKPIPVPANTRVTVADGRITVKGAKGKLERPVPPMVDFSIGDGVVEVTIPDENRKTRAMQGLARSLVANMVTGVSEGFERVLEINGIGYRAEVAGQKLTLNLGFSNPINYELPAGVSATVEKNTVVKLSGIDKEQVGQTAAIIRGFRPPEPYKGKGVKYAEEYVQRKAGKTGTK
ncbi:MAG: 50S ribosomal protein L6 [Desulfococcaceae bacterium]